MSVFNFSETQYVKSVDTGELVRCGGFQVNENAELGYVRSLLYIKGALTGTEKIRTKFYLDANHTMLLYTSDWSPFLISEIPGNWFGWVTTSYNNENLNPNITYYIEVEFTGYTRNAESFYIGVCRDFPYPIYKITPTPQWFYEHPLATQIFHRIWR